MNTSRKLITALILSVSALVLQAQPALKIATVDMNKLYEAHYKTEEQNGKLRADQQKATEELERLNKEGQTLVEQYKEMVDQAKNPALTDDARTKAEGDAQKKMEDIQAKQGEVQNFQVNTRRMLEQRVKSFQELLLEEISRLAVDIAKKRGATLLLDTSGRTFIGISSIVYHDPGYDITEEVMAEINKSRPAATGAAAPAGGAPKAETPTVTFPGSKK